MNRQKITHLMGFTESETAEMLKNQNEDEQGEVKASRINLDLLEKTLRDAGWTFNATDYIVEAVREKQEGE